MKHIARLVSTLTLFAGLGSISQAQSIGVEYCTSSPNSTGQMGRIEAFGVAEIATGNMLLLATDCPPNRPLMFFYGGGATNNPLGNGTLCIDPAGSGISRIQPVQFTDANGTAMHWLTSAEISGPFGGTSAAPTMNYQAWFRDASGGAVGSNLTNAVRVDFQPCLNCK